MSDGIVQRMKERGERARMYLGDGLYASVDAMGQVWLRADGMNGRINEVALEALVLDHFGLYVRRIHALASTGDPLPEEL